MTADEAPDGGDGATPVLNAACLILIDRSDAEARILMGRRLASQVFLPNKWVFPGGRVDKGDHERAAADAGGHLPFILAAVRETYEEAGLCIVDLSDDREFAALSDRVRPLARAITPPGFPRRFDTWFYVSDWDRKRTPTGTPDGELLDLDWFTLHEVATLNLPYITRLIVDDVAMVIAAGSAAGAPAVPFYFQAVDGYARTLINPNSPWPQP